MNAPFPWYIGYDEREHEAYEVCRKSLLRHSTIPLHVVRLNRNSLSWPGYNGIYTRTFHVERGQRVDDKDGKPFSTEFSFTRFLVPVLQQYEGWAGFQDCDMLWRADIADLIRLVDDKYAVMLVKHDHRPKETVKMDGCAQTSYPRKNWSSFVLWNCGHPSIRNLTRDTVNHESGSWLHQFQFLKDAEIGELNPGWNFLVGVTPGYIEPKVLHFTQGGPWFPAYENCPFADEWRAERDR